MMTPAQIVFQAMCRDLLSRGIKPTVKVVYELQDKFRFKFVYKTKSSPWWSEPTKYELNSRYQQIRIDCLLEAGWVLGKNHRWYPPYSQEWERRKGNDILHEEIIPIEIYHDGDQPGPDDQ